MKKFLLLICFALSFTFKSKANHVSGARITYQYVAPNQYLVTLIAHRDCGPGTGTMPTATEICYSSVNTSISSNFIVNILPGSGMALPQVVCLPSTKCVEEYIYQGLVTLPMPAVDWIFSWQLCCRSGGMTNLSSGGNGLLATTALNNVVAPTNGSPYFNGAFVYLHCLNTLSTYNFTANDSDGDSLVYSLESAEDGGVCPPNPIITLGYNVPLTPLNPLYSSTPIIFDSQTGIMTFTGNAIQAIVLAGKVEEYRNGVLIGWVRVDNIIYVINGTVAVSEIAPRTPDISVYPNPTSDYFELRFADFAANKKYEIKILDVMGKEIFQSNVVNPQSEIKISMQGFSPGIYFVQVTANGISSMQKVVKY